MEGVCGGVGGAVANAEIRRWECEVNGSNLYEKILLVRFLCSNRCVILLWVRDYSFIPGEWNRHSHS
jgi:hypothetical protein